MVTHIQIDDRPACPGNCTTYQQYGDCGHQRPSEVVDLKREVVENLVAAIKTARAGLMSTMTDGTPVWEWYSEETGPIDAALAAYDRLAGGKGSDGTQ